MNTAAQVERMAVSERHAHLLAVPDYGRVIRLRGKIVLDFSPKLRGTSRYLWAFSGIPFEDEASAESVRVRISEAAAHMPLVDAVARYRGQRSRQHKANDIVARYLEAAKTTPSERTGELIAPRTLEAYRRVLHRAEPFLDGMTIGEACRADTLRKFKGWFRLPKDRGGRGLSSDHEGRNCFAAFRAVVTWYRTTRNDFPAPDWPSMPTAITAKRRNRSRRKSESRFTLAEVVRGIEAIPEARQPLFWVMFYTQSRPTEAKAVLGEDYERPALTICRSAESKHAGAAIRDTTKTGESGTYALPEWVCDLIDKHCTGARFDLSQPLFTNKDGRSRGGVISDDSIRQTWQTATKKAGLPWVSVYRAFKHTQISALRDAGISIEDIVDQCRWTSAAMLDHYDERKDERRGVVVGRLDEMVGKARETNG